MKNLEKYFSQLWLNIILRSVATELFLTMFFLFYGNSFNAKLWTDEERFGYIVFSLMQIALNILLVYIESEFAKNRDEHILNEIEKSEMAVTQEGELVR